MKTTCPKFGNQNPALNILDVYPELDGPLSALNEIGQQLKKIKSNMPEHLKLNKE